MKMYLNEKAMYDLYSTFIIIYCTLYLHHSLPENEAYLLIYEDKKTQPELHHKVKLQSVGVFFIPLIVS